MASHLPFFNISNMDVYDYIGFSNPSAVAQMMMAYGVRPGKDPGADLRALVANFGEPALKDAMAMHPDRNYFTSTVKKKQKSEFPRVYPMQTDPIAWFYATGQASQANNSATKSEASVLGSQMGLVVLASAVVISIAILSKK